MSNNSVNANQSGAYINDPDRKTPEHDAICRFLVESWRSVATALGVICDRGHQTRLIPLPPPPPCERPKDCGYCRKCYDRKDCGKPTIGRGLFGTQPPAVETPVALPKPSVTPLSSLDCSNLKNCDTCAACTERIKNDSAKVRHYYCECGQTFADNSGYWYENDTRVRGSGCPKNPGGANTEVPLANVDRSGRTWMNGYVDVVIYASERIGIEVKSKPCSISEVIRQIEFYAHNDRTNNQRIGVGRWVYVSPYPLLAGDEETLTAHDISFIQVGPAFEKWKASRQTARASKVL